MLNLCDVNCKNCNYLDTSYAFTSTYSNRSYNPINNQHNEPTKCTDKNVVYMITCQDCNLRYIGETKRAFKTRMYEHRNGIKNGKGCRILSNHFNSGCSNLKYRIIEHINNSDDTDNDDTNRRFREAFWIRELRTKYPYGLNDRLLGDDPNTPVLSNFNKQNKHKIRGKKHTRAQKKTHFNIYHWITYTHRIYATNKINAYKLIFTEVMNMQISNIRKILINIYNRSYWNTYR